MTAADKLHFEVCVAEILKEEHKNGENIGTYMEKRLHRTLKRFFESDEANHEVSVGPYIADIKRDNEIIEVQTGSFYPMRDKLRYYLGETDFHITVVRPLPHVKWCIWMDPTSGEVVSCKKSPKRFRPKDVMRDWYYLSEFIGSERFTLKFLLLEEEEYRFLNGWGKGKKRGSRRYERMPLSLIDEEIFSGAEDYKQFLPDSLGDTFTASEYMKKMKLTSFGMYSALNILCTIGLIEKGEKQGRSYVYKRK